MISSLYKINYCNENILNKQQHYFWNFVYLFKIFSLGKV